MNAAAKRMDCLNRALLVPLLGMGLQKCFLNRGILVPLLGMGLQMYSVNRGPLVLPLGMQRHN